MSNRARCPRRLLVALLAPAAFHVAAADTPAAAAPPKPPAVAPQAASYDLGLMLGGQLEHNGLGDRVSLDDLVRGLRDGIAGHPVSAEEREVALRFSREAHEALAEKNRAAGREFLARNAQQPGVLTTASGLQYRVLAEGDANGRPPGPMDEVTVNYRASLIDGTEFDRSDAHSYAARFRVNGVLKGWREAFLKMRPGAKWQLFVPPDLGYGNNPPAAVPPGSVLVYELELVSVSPANSAAFGPGPAAKPPAPAPSPRTATPNPR